MFISLVAQLLRRLLLRGETLTALMTANFRTQAINSGTKNKYLKNKSKYTNIHSTKKETQFRGALDSETLLGATLGKSQVGLPAGKRVFHKEFY